MARTACRCCRKVRRWKTRAAPIGDPAAALPTALFCRRDEQRLVCTLDQIGQFVVKHCETLPRHVGEQNVVDRPPDPDRSPPSAIAPWMPADTKANGWTTITREPIRPWDGLAALSDLEEWLSNVSFPPITDSSDLGLLSTQTRH